MEIPVKVNVKTTIDEQETFELVVFGRYFQKEQASYLQYEEVLEEGNVRTIVKVAADEALILRSGTLKMRLPFQLNRKLRGSYELTFGTFETTTSTRKLDYSYENGSGQISILYDFAIQESPAGTYHLEISFQEEQK
ncbi:DUF1934 domain-containing protein [Neobacillus rhizophilus]|uniref:DUF1934 domain-containing protein n=1 Tax=Neobacillus rhizophilus TaxID=2833579 RepID=A0A942U524_9BACI|nr:DUF1934 domain-containing protein [Neobacillus rhizophilus]MBS4212552.1 DUF1934 domain-containing protein [Neobacillus rhizophilus]